MEKYNIEKYINLLKENNQLLTLYNCEKYLDKKIDYLSYNSKDIKENTLFVCKGFGDNFKIDYLKEAVNNGAYIYISERKFDIDIPCIIVKNSFISLSIVSKLFCNNVSDKLNLIGITGTKGKSTTSYFVKYILDEYAKENNEKDTAIISSIFTYDGVQKYKSKLTTPESLDLNLNFVNAYNSNIKNVVMEVSSQALKLGRVNDVKYNICAFLNISEDHIGPVEHPDFDDYFNSKLDIFKMSENACINLDSDFQDKILERANQANCNVITFSTKNDKADVFGFDIRKDDLNTKFKVKSKKFEIEVELTIPGFFNVENALAAISIASIMNIPTEYIIKGLKKAKSEGRMEIYFSKDKKILSVVDYAHNKVSFQKIFETTKKEYPNRKIIAIFGCPGNKAQIRRKDLAVESGKNADYIFLTEDDPAFETVGGISKEISKYLKNYTDKYEIIEDREEAIKKAVKKVIQSNDKYIILILGKGNERTQKVAEGMDYYKGDSTVINECIDYYEKTK